MTEYRTVIAAIGCLAVASVGRADVVSGPEAGETVEPCKVVAVTGPFADKTVDYPAERKDGVTVYLFVSGEHFDRPTARFIRELDLKLAGHDLAAVAVWLAEDKNAAKAYLPRLQMSIKLVDIALGVHDGDATGPNGWGLNADAHLTVVLTKAGKVVKSFAFDSVNDKDVKTVAGAIDKAVKME